MAKFTQSNKKPDIYNSNTPAEKVISTDDHAGRFTVYQPIRMPGDAGEYVVLLSQNDGWAVLQYRDGQVYQDGWLHWWATSGSDSVLAVCGGKSTLRLFEDNAIDGAGGYDGHFDIEIDNTIVTFETFKTGAVPEYLNHLTINHSAAEDGTAGEWGKIKMISNFDMNGKRCRNASDAVEPQDYITKQQVDDEVTTINNEVTNIKTVANVIPSIRRWAPIHLRSHVASGTDIARTSYLPINLALEFNITSQNGAPSWAQGIILRVRAEIDIGVVESVWDNAVVMWTPVIDFGGGTNPNSPVGSFQEEQLVLVGDMDESGLGATKANYTDTVYNDVFIPTYHWADNNTPWWWEFWYSYELKSSHAQSGSSLDFWFIGFYR